MLPAWVPVLSQVRPAKQLGPTTVNQITLQLGKTRSDYDKIYKGMQLLAPVHCPKLIVLGIIRVLVYNHWDFFLFKVSTKVLSIIL